MIKSAYGAGFRAGMAKPLVGKLRINGTKVLLEPTCPFSPWNIICFVLWHTGHFDGQMKRLARKDAR
jgi:hypothetical protein